MNYLNNLLQRTYPIVYGLLRMMMAALLVIAGIHAEASTTKFRANGGGGSYGNCDGMTCVSVSVNQGGTQSQPTTFLSYFINQNGPSTITYISGFGQIPNSAADVNGDARVTVNVNSATVPGFYSQACTFDLNSGTFTCVDMPGVAVNAEWKRNRISGSRHHQHSIETWGNVRINRNQADVVSSATVTGILGSVAINSPNGTIGQYRDSTITIERSNVLLSTSNAEQDAGDLRLPKAVNPSARLKNSNYAFTAIEAPGTVFTRAFGINDRGDVVGAYRMPDELNRGFIYRGGTFTTINVPNALSTVARGINNAGLVTGLFLDQDFATHGFVYDGNRFQEIDVPGATETDGLGIDSTGRVSGAYVDSDGLTHGFLLSNGTYTTVDCAGAVGTVVIGVASPGLAAGNCDSSAPGGLSAFIVRNGMLTLVDAPGAFGTVFTGVNASANAGGWYIDADGNEHGVLYRSGEMLTVDDPSAAFSTRVRGINAAGTLVGITDLNRGFIATPR